MAISRTLPLPQAAGTDWKQWYIGMILASIFSLSYLAVLLYILFAVAALVNAYPHVTTFRSFLYFVPILISALLPPIPLPWLVQNGLRPMLTYFEYEEIRETSPVNVLREICGGNKKNYLLVFQPHGVISFCGICSAINMPGEFKNSGDCNFPTAVADAILYTPILKHILGMFGLISASKPCLIKTLKKNGAPGCVVLYVGGIAELFLNDASSECLYLQKRKGFIKLALQQGVDIVPVYLFGNTSCLSILKHGVLAALSRKLKVSLTLFWGYYHLPIPRPTKLLYVSGQPLGMPHLEHPSSDEIDFWHAQYCTQVRRLFDTYKERVPEYKHKQLQIL